MKISSYETLVQLKSRLLLCSHCIIIHLEHRAEINHTKQYSWQGAYSGHCALHSQAIDEQVERGESLCDTMDGGVTLDTSVADTHAEVSVDTSLMVMHAFFTQQTSNHNNIVILTDVLTGSAQATVRGTYCSY